MSAATVEREAALNGVKLFCFLKSWRDRYLIARAALTCASQSVERYRGVYT
jgi:hypothetical protein